MDLATLEEEIRSGAWPEGAALHHPPWTGDDFVPLPEVPALAEAFDAPGPRLVRHLRSRCMPWAAWGLSATIALFGAVQVMAMAGLLPSQVLAFFDAGRIGYDELFLQANWWAPVLSQLTHGGAWHLAANLVVIMVMAVRVQRALGAGSLALISASSVTTGTLAIAWLDDLPAVGSSVLAYGLWGAVLAVGFRFGDALQHERVRGRYGFGTLPLFAVLFAASLGQPATTHVGHFFGLVGGGAAAMVVAAETLAPRVRARAAARLNLALAMLVLSLPVLVQAAVGASPTLLAGRTTTVEVEGVGATLALPRRMADHQVLLVGMPAWTTSRAGEAPLFVGLARIREGVALEEALAEQWSEALELAVEVEDAPRCPPTWTERGGTCVALRAVDRATGEVRDRVVEQVLVRGRTLLRAGWRAGAPALPPRQAALYRHVLASLVWTEPPSLQEARERVARNPASPRQRYELARELSRLVSAPVGEEAAWWREADALLAELADRDDAWAWDAARLRLRLWARAAAVQGPDFAGGGAALDEARAWVGGWLDEAPALDTGIHGPGLLVLSRTGDCAGAWEALARLADRPGGAEVAEALTPEVAEACW